MKFFELNNFGYIANPYQELPLYDNQYSNRETINSNNQYVLCCPQFTPEYRCFLFRCWTLIFIFWGVQVYS